MLMPSKEVVLIGAGLLLAASSVMAVPLPRLSPADALIQNTGSTNTRGYIIYVASSGRVRYVVLPSSVWADPPGLTLTPGQVPKDQAKRLFQDIAAAMPLNSLPVRHGLRSASFGTQTTITYQGLHSAGYQHSPDLTFATDPRTAALKADIDAITKTLHVGNAPRRPIVIQESTKQSSQQHFLERF